MKKEEEMTTLNKTTYLTVAVGALGYFVDIYDLVLFGMVRIASLKSLGVPDSELLPVGVTLLNSQMVGLLLGGILWGILGDKRGRVSVLFGSILLYSSANIANAFVDSISTYALLRFIAGIGLAGELGAAITLVSEVMPKETRGIGTSIVAGIGLSGAVAAGLSVDLLPWRTAYLVGGGFGLVLLLLRIGLLESGMYESIKLIEVRRGDFTMLFRSKKRLFKYLGCIFIGVPIWFVAGILMVFSPELGRELGVQGPILASKTIMYSYIGITIGDLLSGLISQWWRSRRKVVAAAMGLQTVLMGIYLFNYGTTTAIFYTVCALIGFSTGYWAIFVTISSEQFGTNLRATVTTTVPNFVRGSTVPMTLLFQSLAASMSLVQSAVVVGSLALVLGFLALYYMDETYGKDLNYLEVG